MPPEKLDIQELLPVPKAPSSEPWQHREGIMDRANYLEPRIDFEKTYIYIYSLYMTVSSTTGVFSILKIYAVFRGAAGYHRGAQGGFSWTFLSLSLWAIRSTFLWIWFLPWLALRVSDLPVYCFPAVPTSFSGPVTHCISSYNCTSCPDLPSEETSPFGVFA